MGTNLTVKSHMKSMNEEKMKSEVLELHLLQQNKCWDMWKAWARKYCH